MLFLFETLFHIQSFIPSVVDHLNIESMGVSIDGPTETIHLYNFYVHPGAVNKEITLANYLNILQIN